MKRIILQFFLFVFGVIYVNGQCPPSGIVLATQADVNSFVANYSNCTTISGFLQIGLPSSQSDITSISGLSNLTGITLNLSVLNCPNLTSLTGLHNLTSIGGSVTLQNNTVLSSISALNSLNSIGGGLDLINNSALTTISGLNNIDSLGGILRFQDNSALQSITGLNNLNHVGNYITISNNDALTELPGLGNLNTIGGNLRIQDNAMLTSVQGFSGLTSINGGIWILLNPSLTSLTGLGNINPATITNLTITNSGMLSLCNVPSICSYLAVPANPATISGNGTGCVSRIAVETACNVAPPSCTVLTSPANGAANVPVTATFSWNPASSATGYWLSIGTTPGGTDILNNYNVGNVTNYDPPGLLPFNKTLYLRIIPFNNSGSATVCTEYTFTTSATGSAGLGFIANSGSDNVSVINTETNAIIASINVGDNPYGACVTPDGSKSFVANVEGNSISVINNLSLAVETTIPLNNAWPRVIAFSPTGNKAYVTTQTGYLTVIDVATNIVTNSFIIGSLPYAICSSPDGNKLYIGQTGGNIIIFNTQTNTIETTINVGIGTSHIAITPDGTRLFVGDQSASSLKIVSTLNNQVVATIPLGGNGLNSIVINTSGSKAYLSMGYTNDIRVINTADYQILNTIPVGVPIWGLSLAPDDSRLYVASPGSNLVKVISTATNAVTHTIAVGSAPLCYSHPFVTGQPYSPPNTCPTTDLTFTTQSQVDSFPILYPGCTTISGNVQIVGNNIQSLAALSQIETITGYLFIISNPMLVDLQGLHNLTTVGSSFIVNDNNSLTNLNGLNSLTNVGSLEISLNAGLINLQGLENLESAGAGITINDNILLTDLTGLNQLTYAENIYIYYNQSLNDISSISGIEHTTLADLWIVFNPLLSICEVPFICTYLANPNNSAWIEQNATGCATREEVEAACIVTPTLLSLTSTAATIKYHNPVDPATATAANLKIWGDETGLRSGTYTVSNDTVTFQPITPFRAGEVIHITSKSSLLFTGGGATQPFSWMRPSAVSNPTAAVFDTTGTGIILPAAAYGANASYQATMADLNQDGLQDLIHRYISSGGASTNILVYLRNGNGTFAAPVTYNNSASYSILIGTPDLNNDGYPDLVVAHNVPSQIQVRLNNGAGAFGAAALYTVTNYCNGAKIYDVDNDGDLDIIAYAGNASLSQNTISVLKNNGNGTFAAQVTTNTSVFGTSLLPVDLDNDGDGDLAYTSSSAFSSPKVFRVYRNDGTGALSLNNSESNNQEKVLSSAFDYNGDGNVDLISRTPNTDIYLSNSGISYSLASPTTFTTDHALTFSGDLDGDGDLDIFNANSYNGSNWNTLPLKFFLNDGSAAFSTTTTSLVLPGINVTDLSDYDGDGDLDHIYLKPNGEIGVLLNGNGTDPCPMGDITFATQGEIDAFPINYPLCTVITGNVTIQGSGITNLNALSQITEITGNLDIKNNPALINLVGLDNLVSIGGLLDINNNDALTNLNGFNNLATIGGNFRLLYNDALLDLSGLSNLTNLYGGLGFFNNHALMSVSSLSNLTSIGGYLSFGSNNSLTSLSGLHNIVSVGGQLSIDGSSLTNVIGLGNLTTINGNLYVNENPFLTNLEGLNSLSSISGNLHINSNPAFVSVSGLNNVVSIWGNLYFYGNNVLSSLNALSNLMYIGSTITIHTNNALTSLSGLDNIDFTTISGLIIYNCANLSECDVQSVCNYLSFPFNTATITGNDTGCATRLEIETICTATPTCTFLTNPVNASSDIPVTTSLSWSAAVDVTGYKLTVGTTSGGTDIFNQLDVGNVTTYDPVSNFPLNTTIYVQIIPYNASGEASGCIEESFTTTADPCPIGDLIFTTQGEIDAFPVNYPGCTQVLNNVTISGAGISNLNGLSAITSIDGYLDISYNPDLTNMVGLDALSTIGGYLQVYSNAGLVRFTGLGALTEIGDFLYIGANPDLSDFIGLEALTTIGGYLSIQDNALLGSVTGLEALTSIGAEFFIEANPGLTNFNGLNALTSIGGELEILGNAGLTSLSGLEALTSIGSYLSIESNTALTSLTGLENINPETITELYLLNSGDLSYCDIPSICDYLAIPTNPATITGNATGCATRQEIETACNPVPFCTSLTYPTSISTNIPVTAVLSWLVSAGATGYKLNVGTTFGGTEILNNFDVGNVTTYDPPGDFPYGTIIYVRITPYNGAGEVEECGLEQFTTVPGCPHGNVTLLTQAEVDNFVSLHAGCTQINGNLDIGQYGVNSDINNITGLAAITNITGSLGVSWNPLLTSLEGLHNITDIGNYISIDNNDGLTDLLDFANLNTIGGAFYIIGNSSINDLQGFEGLTAIPHGLVINTNASLTDLDGLDNLQIIGLDLNILGNASLTDLTALSNIPAVGGYLNINYNNALVSLTGLHNIATIAYGLNIEGNNSLASLLPLTGLSSIGGSLTISSNPQLSHCEAQAICNYLANPPGAISIQNNATGCDSQAEVQAACPAPPTCTGLTTPAPASTNVSIATNLSWSSVANATGYRLTIGTSPGGTEILNNLDVGNVTTYNPAYDFDYNTVIYVTIVPYNNLGNATGCAEQSFTTQQQSACGTLSGLTATIQSSSSVLVSWNPLSGVNAYQLRYRVVGTTNFTTIAATAATSQLINGLSPNTTYEYQMRVKCNGVWSGYNSLNQFTTPETSPVPACTSLTIPANNAVNVAISTNLTWTASAGATGYLLTIGSTPGGTDLLNNFNAGNVTTYNPPVDFNFNTTIYVTIVPYNGTGNATGCAAQTFTTQQQSNCGTIAGLVAAIQSPTSVLISWNAMAGVNAYQLRYRIVGTTTFTTMTATAATSQLITGLMSNTNYEYQLRVKCNGVWSGYNTLSNFTTPEGSVIPACTSLTNPVNGATNIVISSNISWAASAGATGYLLTIGTTPGGQEIQNNADMGNTTTYNPAIDFNFNTVIYITVVPYSSAGNATGCTTESFTTQQQSDCGTIGGLTTNIQSPTSVLISWNALAGVSAYQLRYRVVGTTTFTTLGGTVTTSQLITGLISDTNYEYQIRIKCNGVWSAYSGLSNFTTPEIVVIPTCTSLTNPVSGAVNVLPGTNLTWSATAGATGYLLTIGTTPGGSDLLNNLNVGNTTTYDPVADFNFNTTFYVKVVPFNSAGNATGCAEQTFTTQQQSDCGTINGLTVTIQSPTSVLISWNPMAGVSRYQLRYRQVGTTTFISPTATAATSLQITGLSPGNTYEYQVQVRCNGVWSGFNALSNFTTITDCTWYADFDNDGLGSEANGTITGTCTPPANYVSNNLDCDDNTAIVICSLPAGNTVSNITSTAATISWTSSPCVTYYQVNYRISGGTWSTPTSVVYGNSITYTGLTPGTTYQYRIRSKCDATSSTSAYVTGGFTTLTPPAGLIEDINGNAPVSSQSIMDFDIYPNPGDGILYLRLDSESEQGASIHLTDMLGRLVLSMEWSLYKGENIRELDLTDYAKGIYQVHIQKGETTGSKKIVLIE